MASAFANDPHSERGFACPRNRFGIADFSELQRFEGPLVAMRGGELEDRPVGGKFDVAHLKSIHRYLFQDVFPWAGEFRVVNLSKGNSTFGPSLYIESALEELLAKLKGEGFLRGLPADRFASRAAFYLGEINAISPFREGNGPTQREFYPATGAERGAYDLVGGLHAGEMVAASILSHTRGECSLLASIVRAAILLPEESRTEG